MEVMYQFFTEEFYRGVSELQFIGGCGADEFDTYWDYLTVERGYNGDEIIWYTVSIDDNGMATSDMPS